MSDLLSELATCFSCAGWAFIVISIVTNVRRRRMRIASTRRQRWQWWVLAITFWILGGICLQVSTHVDNGPPASDQVMAQLNGPISSSSSATDSPDIDACVERWTDAYRKEQGQDTIVTQDQLDEWAQWCKAGKTAP